MQNQEEIEQDEHWRVKTPLEQEYDAIIRRDGDRLNVMEEIMSTVVTDNLRKTAISYNKKSTHTILVILMLN